MRKHWTRFVTWWTRPDWSPPHDPSPAYLAAAEIVRDEIDFSPGLRERNIHALAMDLATRAPDASAGDYDPSPEEHAAIRDRYLAAVQPATATEASDNPNQKGTNP